MTDYSTLVELARRRIFLAEPIEGGTDYLDDDDMTESLNDAFDQMTEEMGGLTKYVEFEVDNAGAITVTIPSSDPPTVAVQSPQVWSYPFYTISDALAYLNPEQLTDPESDDYLRRMTRKSVENRNFHQYYTQGGATRFEYYDIIPGRGFFLGPIAVTETNTIGMAYYGKFVRYSVGTPSQTTGTGLSDLTLGGIYTETDGATVQYTIKITTAGAQDKFKFSVDNGVTYSVDEYDCQITALAFSNGLTMKFGAITGHALNDVWSWNAVAPSLTEFKNRDMRGYPVLMTAADNAVGLEDTRLVTFLSLADKKLRAFRDGIIREDASQDLRMDDPEGTVILD